MPDRPNIFLLTDFGTADHYVAVMKAVILNGCPDANLIDITHHVPPGGIEAGAYLLECAWPWLPPGSVALAVVDPGVGTTREPAAFHYEGKTVIGPNNGLMGFLPEPTAGRVLDKEEFWAQDVSATFHGRDIFAPCAAYVAAGGHWTFLGKSSTMPLRLSEPPAPVGTDGKNVGRIIHFDHFGNAITTLRRSPMDMADGFTIEIPGRLRCPVFRTYGDVAEGAALAYVGSTGRLEIAVRGGNACQSLGLQINDQVSIEPGAVNR